MTLNNKAAVYGVLAIFFGCDTHFKIELRRNRYRLASRTITCIRTFQN